MKIILYTFLAILLILIPSLGVVIYDILKVLRLAGTKKKIDKTLSKKETNVISKEEQDKLKQEIKERLKSKEENNVKVDLDKVLSKINAMDNLEKEEDIELPMAKEIDLPMAKMEELPVVKEKKLPKTKKNTKVPDKKKKYRKKKGR